MTNEEYTEEILHKSHSLGILDDVWELSRQLRDKNRRLDFNGSIEEAYRTLVKET